ncbi:MAG: dihydroorotase family protein [Candidatus Micrarchaeota archaeon]
MIIIKNGNIFLGNSFVKQDIAIDNGVIVDVGFNLKGTEKIDVTGMLVLPGLIDPHVHLREPGDTYKEDFTTGSRAAIAGGFTTVIDMPNNKIPTTTKKRLDEKIRLAKEKAICDVLFHFGGTDDNFDEVKKADPQSMKLYLGETTGMLVLNKLSSLEKHIANFPADRPIVIHASDHSHDEESNVKKTCTTVENTLNIAKKYNHKIHLAHASTKEEIHVAERYENCTIEVAPHYLFLSSTDRERLGVLGKVYPPLKSEKKRIHLWSAMEKVDCIASDHAPHTRVDKENGCAGFPGLETSLAVMLKGCDLGFIDKIWLIQRMTQNVASIFNIKNKGQIRKGFVADITIVDPNKIWKVDGDEFETKCKWSPFEGMELKGKVHTVIKSGKILYQEYHFI